MSLSGCVMVESEPVWLDQPKYESAECAYYSILGNKHLGLKVEVLSPEHTHSQELIMFFFCCYRERLLSRTIPFPAK